MNAAITLAGDMANGQSKNITQVINNYSKRLMGFIRKRVATEADAEDILQDVFYQLVGNTQPINQLAAWLFTVARNKITDKQRKHKPELLEDVFGGSEEDGLLSWTELFTDQSGNPETEYLKTIFWETLNDALAELPEEQRTVFVQHEMENISFNEISEQTGVPVNTLLSRKRYAVLHLRNRLQTLKKELLNY